jgi:hypothetical protein
MIARKIDRFLELDIAQENVQQENLEAQSNTYEELTRETAYDNAYKDVMASAAHEQDV